MIVIVNVIIFLEDIDSANKLFLLPSPPRFSTDFGKNEQEVMKHASNYLKPEDSQALLELLASNQLKVLYQTYDWGLNC